jgi:hypothetical protein
LDLFLNGKSAWTESMAALVHGRQGLGRPKRLTGAQLSGRSRARWITDDGATEREEHGESISGLTGARVVAW